MTRGRLALVGTLALAVACAGIGAFGRTQAAKPVTPAKPSGPTQGRPRHTRRDPARDAALRAVLGAATQLIAEAAQNKPDPPGTVRCPVTTEYEGPVDVALGLDID